MRTKSLSLRSVRRTAVLSTLVAAVGLALTAPPAQAVVRDAQQACGAYDVKPGVGAGVPTPIQFGRVFTINTRLGSWPIECGNGADWGAVHIEVKHKVGSWADAIKCIQTTVNKGSIAYKDKGKKREFTYLVPGPEFITTIVSIGQDGVITAFPKNGNEEPKWHLCALYG